ncbi:hypothetical protein AFL01nite_28610 [Aeromicrobium flavum]|uniref:SGNH hydrolase-type esterase domain-containing protein n=1 Tax=Aeromicrobium flavum TaxID=416568 RepID=A0A512HYN0_9ACTN|nr:SGNH/GDSL hydrolase family protein [Aeromicrobium flavum]GEO90534.1 hypothetical protein AFL01nite_28610 [Aeromicrobium flavum]
MTLPRRRAVGIALATALATSLLTTHAPARASEAGVTRVWDRGTSGEHFVALGDSFTAGPGIGPVRNVGCGRSERNLATLVATALEVATFTDASCSAARTTHYWEPQQANATLNPAQLEALAPDTTLVTIGPMGGNDVDLPGLAWRCLTDGCSSEPIAPVNAQIDALRPVYRAVVADVRRRAPRARIVAVGYGVMVPERACEQLGNASVADLARLQGVADRVSDTIAAVAADEGLTFVDLRAIDGWDDHSACAPPADQWIRGLEALEDGGAPVHPSALGMTQMAAKVLATIRPEAVDERPDPGTSPVPKPIPPRSGPVQPVTSAQRVGAAVPTLRLRAVCTGSGARKQLTARVSGGHGLVTRTSLRVGRRWVATDRRAPFSVARKVTFLKRKQARGTVRATVTVRHGRAVRTVALTSKRPGCLR